MAYERVAGPVGDVWRNEMLAQMHELMQTANYLLGAQCSDEKNPNPVPQPKPLPRPWAPPEPEQED